MNDLYGSSPTQQLIWWGHIYSSIYLSTTAAYVLGDFGLASRDQVRVLEFCFTYHVSKVYFHGAVCGGVGTSRYHCKCPTRSSFCQIEGGCKVGVVPGGHAADAGHGVDDLHRPIGEEEIDYSYSKDVATGSTWIERRRNLCA